MTLSDASRLSARPARIPRWIAAASALILGLALVPLGAMAAQAVAVGVSIQATNATTQPSGSDFTYQVNLSCAGTNAPACNGAVLTIPLDGSVDMTGWQYDVSGGPAGFIVGWSIVGQDLVIQLADGIPAGSSQSIVLVVTPPNLETPNGTTWSLLPSVTSDDPDMNDTTAPAPAVGTATATVPLTVAKSTDRTFYREGEDVEYTITATCPSSAPAGSIYAESMTVVDTLPAGLDFVSATGGGVWDPVARSITWTYPDAASVPEACGGTAPDAAPTTQSVVATVGPVGPGDPLASYEEVTNTVDVSATPLGGGEPVTGSDDRTIVVLSDTDDPQPGTTSLGKRSAGPLNISAAATPDRRGTYPGRWLPNGDNSARPASVLESAPASYVLSPRIQYEEFQYEIRDKLPCLDNLSGVVYTASAGTCANPAFHVLGVRIDYSGAGPDASYTPRYVDTAGVEKDFVFETGASSWSGWVIPTADLGSVSEIVIPRDDSQEFRKSDNITIYGYADASTTNGQVLQNVGTMDWFLRSAADVYRETTSNTADVFILDSPQLGITKTMEDVGAATSDRVSTSLAATLLAPGIPDSDLIVTDLLPAGTGLVTDPDTIGAELTPNGASAIVIAPGDLQVEVIPDYADGRTLVRITLPADQIPDVAGRYDLAIDDFVLTKPLEYGVYTNTAQVFYDSETLSEHCAAGAFGSSDPFGLRGSADTTEEHCEASATFRTVTSASGQFQLSKTVQGDYDASPQSSPAIGHVKLTDGTAQYGLSWLNTGAPTLEGVVLYDIFPFVGDTGVSGAQAGEQRGSQFQPLLASVGTAPDGVTVSFSASENPCRPEVYPGQGACDDDWTTDAATLGGLAAVTAIRLQSGAEYSTGSGMEFGYTMSVPTVDKDLIAWNSVAAFAQTTGGTALLPTEAPKVGITASDQRLGLAKTTTTTHAVPGDTVVYDITVTNLGTSDSEPTQVADALPTGVTFVSATDGGAYDSASRTVTWEVPALERDTSVVFSVSVTIDAQQDDTAIQNRAELVNPPGYSPPVIEEACPDDESEACASIAVPVTPRVLGLTGAQFPVAIAGVALVALLAGGVLLYVRRRAAH